MAAHEFIVPKILECSKFVTAHEQQNIHIGERVVKNYELDYNLSGGRTLYVDGISYEIRPGTLVCRRPGQTVASVGIYNMYMLTIDFSKTIDPAKNIRQTGARIQPLHESYIWDVLPVAFEPLHADDIREIYRRLVPLSKQPGRIVETESLLSELLHLVVADAYAVQTPVGKPTVVDAVLVYMQENLERRITLDELAKSVHLNKSYLIRLFRQNTNMTPIACLNKLRIARAKKLLRSVTLSIGDVAAACGFENEAYFIYRFRRECGVTPDAYRKGVLAGSEQA